MFKKLIKNYTPKLYFFIKRLYYFIKKLFYIQKSYSQEGEDLVLGKLLDFKSKGYYVDVGAHHPIQYSNTYYFYKMGWQGINIDAMPGSMKLFNFKRKRDINLELPISIFPQDLTYYIFESGACNTFSKDLAERNTKYTSLQKEIVLKTSTLESVLDKYLPTGQEIDFFSIDVEGLDLEVLKSNNWQKYRPKYILIEEHDFNLETPEASLVYNYLHSLDYKLVAKTDNTIFYRG